MRYRRFVTNPCRFCGRPTTGTLCGDHMNVMRRLKDETLDLSRQLEQGINYLNRFTGKYGSDPENRDFYQAHATQLRAIYAELRARD